MIELNEWDISTSFYNGYISQYIIVSNIGTYYAEPANNIESAQINRNKLLQFIENELSSKFIVKINKIKK